MDEKYFQPSEGGLKAFDAFPKTKKTYVTKTSRGGLVTVLISLTSLFLMYHEFNRYLAGKTHQHFSVESTVGHHMQLNIDITVAMPCKFLDVNVQDAAGDRVLAGEVIRKEDTVFQRQVKGHHLYEGHKEIYDDDLWDMVGKSREGKLEKRGKIIAKDGCRVYGTMEVNKVQGDFHITAKGHGYWHEGQHLDHTQFNFTHAIDELSFGPYYPKLVHPLDDTYDVATTNFYRFQYYLSIVPTTYTSYSQGFSMNTNQYAVNTQKRELGSFGIPGIFFKFEIEPISLLIEDSRVSFIYFVIRLVNVLSGVAVAGGWIYALWDTTVAAVRRRRSESVGMLNGGYIKVDN